MIPILYNSSETKFLNGGIGRLSDAVSCVVSEERNGVYELEMVYPLDGVHYDDIKLQNIIVARHSDKTDLQPFFIYRIQRRLEGLITVNARHISYKLSKITTKPFSATSVVQALSGFESNAIGENPFTFWTDKTSAGTFKLETPASIRSMLGGTAGSILDAFGGGEYEFDNWTVKLYKNRGTDAGVTIRYGKNLTELDAEEDDANVVSGIVPYWQDPSGGTVITLPEYVVYSDSGQTATDYYRDEHGEVYVNENSEPYEYEYLPSNVIPKDFSEDFETPPTVAQLRAAATSWLANNATLFPTENIKVSFVALWQTKEYENIAPLQRVGLCDTVSVYYTKLGVAAKAKIVKTDYNVLGERYDSMEIGEPRASLYETIAESVKTNIRVNGVTQSELAQAIEAATELIRGGLGGYVVMSTNANGEPEEILIMDTADKNTAKNVIRMNKNGIGFSTNGYNGPFSTAWTIDGKFNASFITTGTMSANLIKGGTLKLGGASNGNGVLEVYNTSNTKIGYWDSTGIHINSGEINLGSGKFVVSSAGAATMTNATINGGSLNINNVFKVTSSGVVTAQQITMGDSNFKAEIYNGSASLTYGSGAKISLPSPNDDLVGVYAKSGKQITITEDAGIYVDDPKAQTGSSMTSNSVTSGGSIKFKPGSTEINILEAIYPVGSIYISTNNQNPKQLFNFGTWSAIGAGRVLVAAGTNFPAEGTGGSSTHSHSAKTSGSTAITEAQMPRHQHVVGIKKNGTEATGFGLQSGSSSFQDRIYVDNGTTWTSYSGGDEGHTHSIPASDSQSNYPPYYAVYMWRRTA